MTNSKPKKIRTLCNDEIMLMNDIKDIRNQFLDLPGMLENKPIIYGKNNKKLSFCLAIGKNHLQIGIMLLKKAIDKPDNF